MIYLSAQPDDKRFIWEIQVQHTNFELNGVDLSNVYALFGYKGIPSNDLLTLKNQLKSNIILIEDTRLDVSYQPTIRPHIIKKFIQNNPHLEDEKMFYHDSDICFTYKGLPNFEQMNQSDYWFVSDTRSYLNYDYVILKGTDVLLDICEITGVSPLVVRRNKQYTGGCQYFLYGTNYQFWNEVEKVSEQIFKLKDRTEYYKSQWAICSNQPKENYHEFQYWVADMIAVQYLAWKHGFDTRLHQDLEFSWACGINDVDKYKIYHNAGITPQMKSVFFKDAFRNDFPYKYDINTIDKNSNTKFYVQEILKTGKKLGYDN